MRLAAGSKGIVIAEIAKELGVSSGSVSHYFNGRNEPKYEKLIAFSSLVGVPIQDLLMPPSEINPHTDAADFSDGEFVKIPVRKSNTAGGKGIKISKEELLGDIAVSTSWLKSQGVLPADVSAIMISDNVMAPTLSDTDVVLINHRQISPTGKSNLFAVRDDEGKILVRRLEVGLDRLDLIMHCDNPDHRTNVVPYNKREDNPVIGRVFWTSRTLPA